ncbi:21237_t:CDS:1, partial [Gigaspora rosea]
TNPAKGIDGLAQINAKSCDKLAGAYIDQQDKKDFSNSLAVQINSS